MPRVPEHSVATRLPHQKSLAIEQQNSALVSDSVIVIKMLAAGVCGTDLAMLSGTRSCRATVLGHEGVGVVVHAPANCSLSGTRVVVNPVHRKQPDIVIGHSCNGVFRQLFCVDAAEALDGGHLISCPSNCALEDSELVLAEPLGSVLYSLELLRERCGNSSLLIRGSGTVAVLAARLWSSFMGSFALLVSQSESHARWLQESIRWPTNIRICCDAGLKNAIRECSSDPQFRAAILCCSRDGAPEGLRSLLGAVDENAMIDLMAGFSAEYREERLGGIHLDRIRWDNICGVSSAPPTAVVDRATGRTVHLIGHRGTSERHIFQAIDLLSRRIISLADVPHRLLTLKQLPAAVDEMLSPQARQTAKWIKAIVAFSREDGGALNVAG